jgi:hypothetical protein
MHHHNAQPPELELLELGLLAPAVVPEVTRTADGRLHIGCRNGCGLPATTDVALAILMMAAHTEVGP